MNRNTNKKKLSGDSVFKLIVISLIVLILIPVVVYKSIDSKPERQKEFEIRTQNCYKYLQDLEFTGELIRINRLSLSGGFLQIIVKANEVTYDTTIYCYKVWINNEKEIRIDIPVEYIDGRFGKITINKGDRMYKRKGEDRINVIRNNDTIQVDLFDYLYNDINEK